MDTVIDTTHEREPEWLTDVQEAHHALHAAIMRPDLPDDIRWALEAAYEITGRIG